MSRKEDSWLKFRELYRSSHEGLGLDTESLKKGFMAGFARGQLTESRSDAYEKGEAQPAGHSSSDGSRSGDSFSEWVYLYGDSHQRDALDGVALKKGFMAGFARGQLTESRSDAYDGGGGSEKKRDSSGGGSGPKVLKKGAAGHGGGKKKRRRY